MTFPENFLRFFKDARTALKKHPFTVLLVFLINLLFFYGAALLMKELFSGFWDGEVLGRLSGRPDLPLPLSLLHLVAGKPLIRLSLPLSLYLAFTLAFSLSTIITGPLLTRMSGRLRNENSNKGRGFLFELREELIMLSWNINLTAVLFLVGAAIINGPAFATPAFYIIMPLIYGLYGLSYYCQPRGWSYSAIAGRALACKKAFLAFALTAASGYFLIFFLSGRLSWTALPFILLLAGAALWRTVVTAAGTEFAARHYSTCPIPEKKRIATKIAETLSILAAVLITATAAHAAVQMRNRLGLLECRYTISGLHAGLSPAGADSKAVLKIHNPTRKTITIPQFDFRIQINTATIADFTIRGIAIPAGEEHRLPLKGRLNVLHTAKALYRAIKNGKFKVNLRGTCTLPLWFGNLRLHLIRQ